MEILLLLGLPRFNIEKIQLYGKVKFVTFVRVLRGPLVAGIELFAQTLLLIGIEPTKSEILLKRGMLLLLARLDLIW